MEEGTAGVCPCCETRRGPVGDPCDGDACARRGYRFIPADSLEAARAFAARKHRPLDPLLGRCIDRYLLAGKIGEGGMGAVYLAIQSPLDREVALKLISGMELTQSTIARFEREARAISVLDHPNVVKLYDYGVGELEFRAPYMALEYVRNGSTLRRALATIRADGNGAIPDDVIVSVFGQVLHALGTAHGVGIVHRDMKPENVMLAPVLGNPHFVKVLDFGLAKAVSDVAGFDATVSRTGQFLGTPCYMAPEQAPRKGQPAADGRSDLYAVAVMLYETFTGVVPFDGQTPLEVLTKKVDPRHDPLAHPEARGLPPSIRAFLRKGMAADPELRFGTAEEMLAALGQALSGRAAAASGPERTARRRHGRGLLRVAAPAVLVAVLAGAAAAWLARDTRPQEAAATVVEPGPPEAPTPTPAPEQPAPASPPTAAEPVAATIPVASPTGMRVRFESDPTGAEVSAGGSARERQPGRLPGHGCASARARRWSSPEAS